MKVNHLHGGTHIDVDLTLHSQITVLRGLQDPARQWCIDTLAHLGVGRGTDAAGEVEASGIHFPLTDTSLSLLGLVVARSTVVVESDLRPTRHQPAIAGQAIPTGADRDRDHELSHPWTGPGDAPSPLALQPGAGAEPASLAAPPDDLPVLADVERHNPVVQAIDRRLGALRTRRMELSRLAEEIELRETEGVEAALAALELVPVGTPRPGAAELADRWRDLQREHTAVQLATSSEERAAMAEVAQAEMAVADAEAVLRQPQLTEDQIARIESAHADYVEATDKVERRFGGGRARKAVADAEAEETRLLARFGFDSWVDYMLSMSKRAADPDRRREKADLERATEELQVCVGELEAIPGAAVRRRRRAELAARQDEISAEAAVLLGHQPVGSSVEEELRALRVEPDRSRELQALVTALRGVGTTVREGLSDGDGIAAQARDWLDGAAHDRARREELEVAVAALDGHIDLLVVAAAGDDPVMPELPALPDMAEPPVGLLDMIEAIELPDSEHDQPTGIAEPGIAEPDIAEPDIAEPVVDALELALPEVSEDRGAVAELTAGEPPEGDPGGVVPGVPDPLDRRAVVEDVVWRAMVKMADCRSDGPAGHLPLILDDPFGDLEADEVLEVLSRLGRFTDLVQMVVVSDRPEIATWAHDLGREHAMVVG